MRWNSASDGNQNALLGELNLQDGANLVGFVLEPCCESGGEGEGEGEGKKRM